ncbi:MAG: hypothetical protein LBM96_06845 [Methanobrevibacter sp.]|jgi:formylmethanofuran dehydrogenase subunit C|nr:hypothetical protein [Candidatus Methanoflexus mossambicus]
MVSFFKKKGKKLEDMENLITLDFDEAVDCIADFTYNFYWAHKGEKLDYNDKIPQNSYTYKEIVDHLKNNGNLKINGDAGHRLASSMGVDLAYFGGSGKAIDVGNIFVEGDVSSRMGISMIKGAIYVKGNITDPIGNLVEVKSDFKGYKKFVSLTEIIMENKKEKMINAEISGKKLIINDGLIRDTLGARLNKDFEIVLNGDADLSTGILMRNGLVRIKGNAGKNSGTILNGGTIIIDGNTDDFTAAEMKKGTIIINGNAGKFLGANRISGTIFAKKGSPIPPLKEQTITNDDKKLLNSLMINPNRFLKFN